MRWWLKTISEEKESDIIRLIEIVHGREIYANRNTERLKRRFAEFTFNLDKQKTP